MRDIKQLEGEKIYVESMEDMIAEVRKVFPAAHREGSVAAYHFAVGEEVVAEAWIHRTKPGWWLRLKKQV